MIVLVISPSSELGITLHFVFWIPYYSRNILSNFKIFVIRIDWLASGSTCSLSQLVWSTDFVGFGAQILLGSGP